MSKELMTVVEILETLNNVDKYRWHDIVVDPSDVPQAPAVCLCAVETGNYHNYEVLYFDGSFSEIVIAWRYIEPFTGGNHENPDD